MNLMLSMADIEGLRELSDILTEDMRREFVSYTLKRILGYKPDAETDNWLCKHAKEDSLKRCEVAIFGLFSAAVDYEHNLDHLLAQLKARQIPADVSNMLVKTLQNHRKVVQWLSEKQEAICQIIPGKDYRIVNDLEPNLSSLEMHVDFMAMD